MEGFPPMPTGQTAPTFDLQSHSTHSDGALAPAEVVERAANAGVTLLALTDHDTVDGVEEALAAARVKNIELTPAVEMSAVHDAHEDLHILGYGLDHTDRTLLDALDRLPGGPRAPDLRDGRPAARARLRARRRRASRPTQRPAARTSPTRSSPIRPTRTGCARRGSTARTSSSPPTSSRARPGYVARSRPTVAAGDRRHPRRRRRRRLGAPVLGRRRPGADAATQFAGVRHRRRRGVLRHLHRRADRGAVRAPRASAGC